MDNINTNLDLSVLDNLTPAEKELALSILKEYSEQGESQQHRELLYEDYNEIPVDIETFVDDYEYLGNAWHDSEGKTKLYPYWRKELKKIFPNNIDTNVNNAILTGSRGRGKALPNSSYVRTIDGLKKVGDVKENDYLIDRYNKPTKVLGVFPQGKKQVYKIIFEDNRTAKCCVDHLWLCTLDKENFEVKSLKELLNENQDIYIPLNTEDEKCYGKRFLKICSIEDLSQVEEMTCFYVDNKEHLFQLDNGIVTHNTEIAVLMAAYLLHRVLCLKDPVAHFHLKPTEKIVFAFMNIKLDLAEEIGIAKFQNTIQSSPWFMKHGVLEGRTRKLWVPQKYNGQEAIDIKIGSQSDDLIGLPLYFVFFDEVSFQRNQDIEKQKQKANDAIDTAIGGMKTRFVFNGKNMALLVLASSKRSEKSFLEEHVKKKLKSEKDNVYISDGSVWEVKPAGTYQNKYFKVALGNKFLQSVVVPEEDENDLDKYLEKGYKLIDVPYDFKADFLDDIDRALCDFAGISSSSITKYISGAAVNEIITDRIQNPFTKEILEIGNGPDDEAQYYHFFDLSKIDPALKNKPLFIHLDMSISGDKTGIAGVFIKGKKPSVDPELQNNDLFYSLAFSVSIKAPKGRQISFDKNRNFIYWLKEKGFNIKGISTDTFQAYDTGQTLLQKGFPYEMLSVDRVDPASKICKPYQYFKSTIYDKRLEIYNHRLLIQEITELERSIDTGKVDHPDGGCFTGETKIRLVDGRSLTFLELIDEYNNGKENYVYSINIEKQQIEPKKIIKAWKTLENQPLVKITFDNSESVECTLTHKFMLRNGAYVEAKDLLPDDSLMPLYVKISQKGLQGYRMIYEPFENKWHYEHRQFAQEILDEKYLVHHKDCNKLNNNPSNLVWCSKTTHAQIHAELETGACSPEALDKKAKSIAKWHQENKNTVEYIQRNEKTRKSVLKYNLQKYRHNTSIDRMNHIKDIEDTFNVTWDNLTLAEKNAYGTKLARLKNPDIQKHITEKVSENHKAGKYKNAEVALATHNKNLKTLKILFPRIDNEKFVEIFGFEYDSLPSTQKPVYTNRYRQKMYELQNHKVMSIEFIDKRADVYDITVEDNHNFALDAGVFVHNSKDACDATCAAIFEASKHAEEFAYDFGETAENILRINTNSSLLEDSKSIAAGMEEELKSLKGVLKPATNQTPFYIIDGLPQTTNTNYYNEIIIL